MTSRSARLARFIGWLGSNVDGVIALAIALVVAVLGALDVLGSSAVNSAILLTLAVLATTLLRDRHLAMVNRSDASAVRALTGRDTSEALEIARRHTDQWTFKGGTGTYLRAVTLPRCIENARADGRSLRVQIEILDPADERTCTAYTQFRRSLSTAPDRTGEEWTFVRTRNEALATILAASWYLQRHYFLIIDLGLSTAISTLRWDLSSNCLILTQEDPSTPALIFEKANPYYHSYHRELVSSFERARRVAVDRDAGLSNEPSTSEVRDLFDRLEINLQNGLDDADLADVIRRAIHPRNPYW